MDDLINEFIAETREMLDSLGGAVVAWEAAPGERERLDEIFRFVHTVKGNSGFFDLPRIQSLSHAAEDALAAVRGGKRSPDPALVSAVLAAVDRIGELVDALAAGETPAGDDEALIAALGEGGAPLLATGDPVTARAPARTIRLSVDLLDRMMSGISDLVLARNELGRQIRESGDADLQAAFDRVSGTLASLRDAIARTRMQRLDNLFAPIPRVVRDLGAETGKEVELEIDGGDVEIDREMIEMIRDPLTHIIRNAIDHGLEPPEVRRRLGKPAVGKLAVCARQAGNQILLDICDDGRGIDSNALVDRALTAGLVTAERARQMSEPQKLALMFEAGLSTAAEVTAISGRGVGMDVVRANIERIGGVVEVDSREGKGARFTLKVPLTLTIIPTLIVQSSGQIFAIPRSAIEEIVRIRSGHVRVESVGGGAVVTVRGRRLPLVCLAATLGTEPAADPTDQSLIVLRPAGGGLFALAVDSFGDHEELVVKPAAPAIMATGLYAGTTIADDGRPILLLDAPGIAARAGLSLDTAKEVAAEPERSTQEEGPEALLFRTLSGGLRLVPLAAVQRIDDVAAQAVRDLGGRLSVVVGDALLPLEGCSEPPDRRFRLLRLSDGELDIAYGFDEVLDTIRLPADRLPVVAAGEVAATVLVGGEQAELLDLHWILARHARPEKGGGDLPICVLPAGDAFMAHILAPLVESAGYRVIAAGSPGSEAARVVIVDGESVDAPAGARVVRLRSDTDPESPDKDGIHRYDRAALLATLAASRSEARKERRG